MAQKGRGIFLLYADIDTEHEDDFRSWYDSEHLPELRAVPGILSAARYEAHDEDNGSGPKFLACYELENAAVLQSAAFKNRPRTEWGARVSPTVIGKNLIRISGEQIFPAEVEMSERGMAPVLQIGRMSVPEEADEEWNRWYNGEYIPGYRKVPGVVYARRYRVHEGTVGYTTVYEFENADVSQSAKWQEQQRTSSRNTPRMRKTMTHATGSPGIYVRIDY
ncbi:MAG: hypothetical protein ACI9DC_000182 [Gammaproteobacteria bacterium]